MKEKYDLLSKYKLNDKNRKVIAENDLIKDFTLEYNNIFDSDKIILVFQKK